MEGKVALISGVGSQYALPVATPTASSTCGRQLVAIDYSEEALKEALKANPIPQRAILPTGSAGGGLSFLCLLGSCRPSSAYSRSTRLWLITPSS